MPEQRHPPYGSSTLQPRILNRWLDVNSQNGPLGRFNTYITIPAFSDIIHDWKGYSEIVGTINYMSLNNFSLKEIPQSYFEGYNFLLCIAWLKSSGVVYRYLLNNVNTQDIVNFDLPLYTNQLIGKNFRIEIWSANASYPVNYASSPPLFTSVLGDRDTRFGDDKSLSNPQDINLDFYYPALSNGTFSLPFMFPAQSAFIPQNAVFVPSPITDFTDDVTKLSSVIPVIDIQTGERKFIRVVDSTIMITTT